MRPSAHILHPFPRFAELDRSVDGSKYDAYRMQTAMGPAVRERILRLMLALSGYGCGRLTDSCAPPAKTISCANQDASVRKMIFRAYVLCIFTMVFCVNDPAPLFELFRRADGLGPSELSMLYAVYAAVVIVTLPFFGRASDRLGRRSLVVLGLSFIVIGSLVLAVAGSFSWLVGGRLLQGLGIAAMSAPATAALAELAGAQRQAAAASIMAVALAVGGASGTAVFWHHGRGIPDVSDFVLALLRRDGSDEPDHDRALTRSLAAAAAREPAVSRPPDQFVAADAGLLATTDATEGLSSVAIRDRIAFWQACVAVVACFGAQATFFTVSGPIFGTLLASHVLLTAGCAMSALMVASGLGAMSQAVWGQGRRSQRHGSCCPRRLRLLRTGGRRSDSGADARDSRDWLGSWAGLCGRYPPD